MRHVRDRPGHDRRYAIDPTVIESELGFEPVETLASGLARTVSWYLANESWWRDVMDGSFRSWITRHYESTGSAERDAPDAPVAGDHTER